jgi:hypothetical protein
MPRSIEEILEQADQLASRFETHEPGEVVDAVALRTVRSAFLERAEAERRLADAVSSLVPKAIPGQRSARWSGPQAKPPGSATGNQQPNAELPPRTRPNVTTERRRASHNDAHIAASRRALA